MAVVSALCVGKPNCHVKASCDVFHEKLMNPDAFCWDVKKSLAVSVTCKKSDELAIAPVETVETDSATAGASTAAGSSFWADFGRELQGGLRLTIEDGTAGETVHITCGESTANDVPGSTWGWEFDWTLRDGAQVLEQHKVATASLCIPPPHLP
jgi:hypothetical protein